MAGISKELDSFMEARDQVARRRKALKWLRFFNENADRFGIKPVEITEERLAQFTKLVR